MCAKAPYYLAKEQQYIRWHNGDILQGIVKRQWGELDKKWNRTEVKFLPQEEVDDAYTFHFTSPEKPWVAIEKNPLSILFYIHSSDSRARVYQVNYFLRKLGLTPTPLGKSAWRNWLKVSLIGFF